MIKKSRPTKHHPGELERMTVLIEGRAREIAELLLGKIPDAEQAAEATKPRARRPRRKTGAAPTAKPKPDRKRDIQRREAISAWRHKAFRH
jgi:hypothetical protein